MMNEDGRKGIRRRTPRYLFPVFVFWVAALCALSIVVVLAAETLSGLTVDDLSVTYTNGDWTGSGSSISGSVTGETGTCSSSATTSTLVLTNGKTSPAKLIFNYTVTLNSGSLTVGGISVTEDGNYSYSGDIEEDGTLQIVLKSESGSSYTSYLTITDIYLVVESNVTTTFAAAENGSYTVNGTEITESTSYTQSSTMAYTLEAAPADGYQFLGWYSTTDEKYLSTSASVSFYSASDQTVTAVFGSESAAVFETGGGRFTDLNEAVTYAQKMSASMITLVADGPLPAGNYTIPNGITLLIPFDDAGTCYTTEPEYYSNTWSTPSAYRTLTMESGASITVEGAISISAKVNAASSGTSSDASRTGGSTDGFYGYIYMEDGSGITIEDGGNLYCWGYLSGDGAVTAESGAAVYEPFQLADFRGGTATLNIAKYSEIFPLSQWYLQNIEAELTVKSGATETGFTALYASSTTASASVSLVGKAGGDGMFRLEDGARLVKTYDPATDRTMFEIYGNSTLSGIILEVMSQPIDSSDYKLPLNTNIDLVIRSGTTTVEQDIDVLPGVEITVDENAVLIIGEGQSVYLYDLDNWDKAYFYGSDIRPTVYSPTRTYTRMYRDLKDAVIDVNGKVIVNGALYTTESGASIISSEGTGKVVFTNGAGTATTTQQITQSGSNVTYVDIAITSAQLLNGDGTYTTTEGATSGTTYTYCGTCGKWYENKYDHCVAEVVWEDTTKESTVYYSLENAMTAALVEGETNTVRILQDITLSDNSDSTSVHVESEYDIVIDEGESLILDLNGYAIASDKDSCITNYGALEIKRTADDSGTGGEICTSATDSDGIYNTGALTITGSSESKISISGTDVGIYNAGTIISVSYAEILGTESGAGDGVYNIGTITKISNCEISGECIALYNAVYTDESTEVKSIGRIGTISNVVLTGTAGCGLYNAGTIGSMTEVTATSSADHGVFLADGSTLVSATGGVYSTTATGKYGFGLYDSETLTTALTDGYYLGADGDYTSATNAYTDSVGKIADGYMLSTATYGDLTGDAGDYKDYYYIGEAITVSFNYTDNAGDSATQTDKYMLVAGSATVNNIPTPNAPDYGDDYVAIWKGWYTDGDGTGTLYEEDGGTLIVQSTDKNLVDGVLNLYAVYEKVTIPTVYYYLDESKGTLLASEKMTYSDGDGNFYFTVKTFNTDSGSDDYNENYVIPDGYEQDGWLDADNDSYAVGVTQSVVYTDGEELIEELVLYPNWKALTYEVSFDSNSNAVNGGEISGTTTSIWVTYNSAFGSGTDAADSTNVVGLPTLTCSGYIFKGWAYVYDENEETVTVPVSGETLMEWPTSLTLTAQWEEDNSGIVTSAENKSMPYYTDGTTLDVTVSGEYIVESYQWYLIDNDTGERTAVSDESGVSTASEDASAASTDTDEDTDAESTDGSTDTEEGGAAAETASVQSLGARTLSGSVTFPIKASSYAGIGNGVNGLSATLVAQMETLIASLDSSGDEETVADGESAASDASATGESGTQANSGSENGNAEESVGGADDGTGTESDSSADDETGAESNSNADSTNAEEETGNSGTDTEDEEESVAITIEEEADVAEYSSKSTNTDGTTTLTYEVPRETNVGEYTYICEITAALTSGGEACTAEAKVTLTVTPLTVTKISGYTDSLTVGNEATLGAYLSTVLSGLTWTVDCDNTTQDAAALIPVDNTNGTYYTWETEEGETETAITSDGYYSLIFSPDDTVNFDYSALTTYYDESEGTFVSGWNAETGTLKISIYVSIDAEIEPYTVTWSDSSIADQEFTEFTKALEAANTAVKDSDGNVLTATLTVPSGQIISGDVNVNRYTTLVLQSGAVVAEGTSVLLLGKAELQVADDVTIPASAEVPAEAENVTEDTDSAEGYTVYTLDPQLTIGAATLTIGDQISINYAVKSESSDPADGLVYATGKDALFAALRSPFGSATTSTTEGSVEIDNYTVLQTEGVKPTELATTMYTTAYAGNGTYAYSQTAGYSVWQYVVNMLNSSGTSDTLKRLLYAILNYGAEAETQFLNATTPAATSGVSGVPAVTAASPEPDENYPDNMELEEISTSLGSDFSIALPLDESVNFMIAYSGEEPIRSVAIDLWDPNEGENGDYVSVTELTDKTEVTVDGETMGVYLGGSVPPRNYDNWYRFIVTMDDENSTTYTAYYSVFTYLNKALVDSSIEVNADLIYAMVEYCYAAEEYERESDSAN